MQEASLSKLSLAVAMIPLGSPSAGNRLLTGVAPPLTVYVIVGSPRLSIATTLLNITGTSCSVVTSRISTGHSTVGTSLSVNDRNHREIAQVN